jgi:tetratricopeptide (TPR) repeat protein
LKEFPNRPRNHEIENLSEIFLKNCLPVSWIVNTYQIDYGTDYNCEITTNNKVIGNNFSIQLKGKEKESNSDSIKIKLKRTTINRWLNKLEPIMVVAYIADEKEAFWIWFENNTVDLTLRNETHTISIPRVNRLSNNNWENISKHVSEIFSKRHLLYEVPKIDAQNKNAWKSFYKHKFEKALSIFSELLKQKPKDTSILEAMALCEYQLFNYQKALININNALEIKYSDNFILNKASILTEQGFLNNDFHIINDAIKLYEKLILNGDITYGLYYNYGSALMKINKFEKSIYYFKKAIRLNPNSPEVWSNLGNAYLNLGKHDLEILCYDSALHINPNLAETLFSKGTSLFRYFGKAEDGLKLMLESTKKSNRYKIDNPNVFFWISECYLSKNDSPNALNWNTKGLALFSRDEYLKGQKRRIEEIRKNNS